MAALTPTQNHVIDALRRGSRVRAEHDCASVVIAGRRVPRYTLTALELAGKLVTEIEWREAPRRPGDIVWKLA